MLGLSHCGFGRIRRQPLRLLPFSKLSLIEALKEERYPLTEELACTELEVGNVLKSAVSFFSFFDHSVSFVNLL